MTRNTGRPPMFFNGKYDRCVDGSTATTWAWAASRPSSIFRTPLASTRNLDMTPASPATYSVASDGSNASTSGLPPMSNDWTIRIERISRIRSLSFPSQAMNASRSRGSISNPWLPLAPGRSNRLTIRSSAGSISTSRACVWSFTNTWREDGSYCVLPASPPSAIVAMRRFVRVSMTVSVSPYSSETYSLNASGA
ncbi:putative surface antigen domain protein [Burkholderia pseudomallei MSHR5569]|nr:putative surface antigen domain protein [Burkholderia pseudomallei MSHR5569]